MRAGIQHLRTLLSQVFPGERTELDFALEPIDGETGTHVLTLLITDRRWRTSLLCANAAPNEAVRHQTSNERANESALDPISNLRDSLASISDSDRRSIANVRIIVSDPAIEIYDNRLTRIRHDDPETVRDYAARQAGTAESAFAISLFGESSSEEQPREVVFSASMDTLRPYLIEMGALSLKTTAVVPRLALLLGVLAAREDVASCAIDISGRCISVLFANRVSGSVFQQTIPVGTETLASALADEMGVGLGEARDALSARTLLPDPQAFLTNDFSSASVSTGTATALRAPLNQIFQSLREGLDFFAFQRLNGTPTYACVTSEAGAVKGFEGWLQAVLDLDQCEVASDADLENSSAANANTNLLQGGPKDFLTIGERTYRFEKGRFIENELTAAAKAKLDKSNWSNPSNVSALLGEHVTSFDAEATKQVGAFAALVATMIFGVWQLFSGPADVAARNAFVNYERTSNQAVKLSRPVEATSNAPADGASAGVDVVWAPKVSAVARHVIDGMWITSITAGSTQVRAERAMEISGFVKDPGEGALANINQFVRRLKSDDVFMQGLREVKLIRTAQTAGENEISFLVAAQR